MLCHTKTQLDFLEQGMEQENLYISIHIEAVMEQENLIIM